MGEVISLDHRRRVRGVAGDARSRVRQAGQRPAATMWFDLGSPGTYFAAERAERQLPGLAWHPVLAPPALAQASVAARVRDVARRAANARALELRMPLVWPEGHPGGGRAAMRVACFAAGRSQASAFVLAASRLAFCGGFDLDDPEILAEAAAAAALPLDDCLHAAGDRSHDATMEAAGRRLLAGGADLLPTVEIGGRLFCGEERLAQAVAALRDPCAPLRPAPLDESAG